MLCFNHRAIFSEQLRYIASTLASALQAALLLAPPFAGAAIPLAARDCLFCAEWASG